MSFTPEQASALAAPLDRGNVKQREQAGRKLSYVESWHAIAEANRIFGFDGWSSETLEIRCVSERERKIGREPNTRDGWGVSYVARVRVVAFAGDTIVTRDGVGAGHGIDTDLGLAHESAIKEAESDSRKRALMTFGNPFGLALYDKTQSNVASEPSGKDLYIKECQAKIAGYMDAAALTTWWNDEPQKKARRDFDLDHNEVEVLKNAVIARREGLNKRAA